MKAASLIALLEMFPKDMDVLVQTCEGDFCSPLEHKNIWLTNAGYDERLKILEPSRLVITSYVESKRTYSSENKKEAKATPETRNEKG